MKKIRVTPTSAEEREKEGREQTFPAHSLQLREGLVALESLSKGSRALVADAVPVKAVRQKKRTDKDNTQGQCGETGMIDFPLTHLSL